MTPVTSLSGIVSHGAVSQKDGILLNPMRPAPCVLTIVAFIALQSKNLQFAESNMCNAGFLK